MRNETFPILDPTRPDGPRGIANQPWLDESHDEASAEAERVPSRVQARDEPCADPGNCDVHTVAKPTLPATPPWVTDVQKWQDLSRAERRQLERHHRKVNGLR